MIDVKNKCFECAHRAMCKYSNDYIGFYNRLSDIGNKLSGENIAEDIVQVNVTCKYYSKLLPQVRSNFELR